ncbi:hypothetical protein BKP45_14580 [Anaerobacillus alkalidiazotrophicus]|uniref:YitT family protein n=1 Tax=Anaerobacillus alkalidiazotrophicus TaxID=472963 RepID=A0A1S2M343_9BACI|nr:YitT family protein [Anaerobacillus alkalidiazotrophicus]OIJ18950.1 hypothetical protein BKP45_14580 [Anaerobacillus alkalidiazotrophicus]
MFLKQLWIVLSGLFLTAFGIKILAQNLLTFGGTAGIATIFTYFTSFSWGLLFLFVNLPFFIISIQQLGKWFTLSSLLSIISISIIRDAFDFIVPAFQISDINATVLAGVFIGIGVTLVLNNGSSLGGIHILALYLDKKFNLNRGFTIFVCDSLIILFAVLYVGWNSAFYSIACIVIASFIIGRYKVSPIKEVKIREETIILNEVAK